MKKSTINLGIILMLSGLFMPLQTVEAEDIYGFERSDMLQAEQEIQIGTLDGKIYVNPDHFTVFGIKSKEIIAVWTLKFFVG